MVDWRCSQPFQEEIHASFVFGRSFIFQVSIEKVRSPSLETINQHILNAENAKIIYSKLWRREINAFALLSLHPVLYILPSDAMNNEKFEILFKKWVNKTIFLTALNGMKGCCGHNSWPKQDSDLMNYEQKSTSSDQAYEYQEKN
jgi:hypothetical protein